MSFKSLLGDQVNVPKAQKLPLAAFGGRDNSPASILERTERARADQQRAREDAAQALADELAADLTTKEAEREEQLELTAETEQRMAAAHAHKLKSRFSHMLKLYELRAASDEAIKLHLERPADASLLLAAQEAASALYEAKYLYIRRVVMSNTGSPLANL